jgi:hypothetical protein
VTASERAGRYGFAAVLLLVAFLVGLAGALTRWPALERSRPALYLSYSIFLVAFLVLLGIATNAYRQAKLLHRYAGCSFVFASHRKGWHSLFSALAVPPPAPQYTLVWWRDRAAWGLDTLPELNGMPPIPLPFLARVSGEALHFEPLGAVLREHRARPLPIHSLAAHRALLEATSAT